MVLLALLAVLIAGDPGRIDRQKTWLRVVTGAVIAFITVASLLAAARRALAPGGWCVVGAVRPAPARPGIAVSGVRRAAAGRGAYGT